jgi:ribosomal-protein-alanine N-acetyltransferase
MRVEGFRVRVAEVVDLAEVVALERGVAEAPHWAEAEYAAMVNADRRVDGSMRRCFFVAEVEGRLLGFSVGKVIGLGAGAVAELESVAVDGSVRRLGVGRALCEAVVSCCRAQGAEALELEVRAGSDGAIALYTSLGFSATGRRGGYYLEPVEDAVLMRLNLVKDH